MSTYIALLRAANVGGTGRLPMSDLVAMCEAEGFGSVRTYIASGNVVFTDRRRETTVKAALEKRLHAYAGKPVGALVRTVEEMRDVLAANPFATSPPSTTVAIFHDEPVGSDALADMRGRVREDVRAGRREIYVAYGDGMGRSKLKIPAANMGTARNINTIRKLVEMAGGLSVRQSASADRG